jgi:hypothetical protein
MADRGLKAIAVLVALVFVVPVTAIVVGLLTDAEEEPTYVAGVPGTGRPLRWVASDRVLFEKPGGRGVAVLTVDGKVPLDLEFFTEFSWAESPDGTEAAFVVVEQNRFSLYIAPLDRDGRPRLLVRTEDGSVLNGVRWTADGRFVVFDGPAWTSVVPREGGAVHPYVPASLVRASATVEVPPSGPHDDYVPVEPTYARTPVFERLEPGRKIGPWSVAAPGDELVVEASGERCRALLPSPDRRFLACVYSFVDVETGVSESLGVIVGPS